MAGGGALAGSGSSQLPGYSQQPVALGRQSGAGGSVQGASYMQQRQMAALQRQQQQQQQQQQVVQQNALMHRQMPASAQQPPQQQQPNSQFGSYPPYR